MIETSNWLAGVRGIVAECGRIEGLAIGRAEGRFAAPALASRGFPALVPLWSGMRTTVALLPLPATDARNWPAIIESEGDALVLASDAATALPRFWMLRLLASSQMDGSQLAEALRLEPEGPAALHVALGGAAETLAAVKAVIDDDSLREELVKRPRDSRSEQPFGLLARRVDQSAEFAEYADWFDAVLAGGTPELADIANLGVWGRQAAYWAARVGPPDPTIAAADRLHALEAFAGIGSGVPSTPTWAAQPGGASGRAAHYDLAAPLDPNEVEDEIHKGILTALHAEGIDYDGFAHAEAVVALDEGGKPERAWGALHSAAWWGGQARGDAPPAMLNGARLLARRHGWDDIAWAIEGSAEGAS